MNSSPGGALTQFVLIIAAPVPQAPDQLQFGQVRSPERPGALGLLCYPLLDKIHSLLDGAVHLPLQRAATTQTKGSWRGPTDNPRSAHSQTGKLWILQLSHHRKHELEDLYNVQTTSMNYCQPPDKTHQRKQGKHTIWALTSRTHSNIEYMNPNNLLKHKGKTNPQQNSLLTALPLLEVSRIHR